MYHAIKNFNKQFEYQPKIENEKNFKKGFSKFIIAGMGGSNLVANLLRIRDPQLDIIVHKNYGLPAVSKKELRERLLIVNSYSGNTEEALDSFSKAFAKKIPMVVIATGGKLLALAKKHNLPYIQIPSTDIQPRAALGLNIKAIAKFLNRNDLLKELNKLSATLEPSSLENAGKQLAKKIKGYVPIIYSSTENIGIAYNWKIKFNETGKIPAFCNVFSELNHNEMTGYDIKTGNQELIKKFYFIILRDKSDHPRIQKRMQILEKLYQARNLPLKIIHLSGTTIFDKIFSSLILADWTAYYTALQYNLEPTQVPMVEEFKKLV